MMTESKKNGITRSRFFLVQGSVAFLFILGFHAAYAQGLVERIESPEEIFLDARRYWVGEEIQFLRDSNAKSTGSYFGFFWDPDRPRQSTASYGRLVDKRAKIEEVWVGSVSPAYGRIGTDRSFIAFWKMRLMPSNKVLWYWDEGNPYIFGTGFVSDYRAARGHVGDSLWVKETFVLHSMDGREILRLMNTERVVLADVRWGAYANFPLVFVLETEDGRVGHLTDRTTESFLARWHRVDPRKRHADWEPLFWTAIERRQLTRRMRPEMVVMSWGEPMATSGTETPAGVSVALWVYRGVKKRLTGLFFIEDELVDWPSVQRQHVVEDMFRFAYEGEDVSASCDVYIHWEKLERHEPAVTFFW
jgi:hypothetical protein